MHKPRKRLGQNFLKDQNIIANIIDLIAPKTGDCILEIGPGTGALSSKLLQRVKNLYAVEIDSSLAARLADKYPKLTVFTDDALKFNLARIPCENKIRLVGNLPYNISTPLLLHFLRHSHKIYDMHFMLQKEVADRIMSEPDRKTFGRLAVMLQTFAKVEKLAAIPPNAFWPKPKVHSAFMRIIPNASGKKFAPDEFSLLVKAAFAKRRKTLRNNLKSIMPENCLAGCPLDLSLRAENLSVADYADLFSWYGSTVR